MSNQLNKVEPIEHAENCANKDENYNELKNDGNTTNDKKEAEPEMIINDNYSQFSLTYTKGALLIFTISLNIITTFLRGSNKAESIIGLKQCDDLSWIIFGIYLLCDLLLCYLSGLLLRSQESPELKDEEREYSWHKIITLNGMMI